MTTDHEASRTLVKSPPELWAECSDAESLARHLGEFGEIHITRVEPETIVAWEGQRASGTVRIEPSGWGTRVTLTARTAVEEPPAAAVEAEPAPVVEEEPVAVVEEEEPAAVVEEPGAVVEEEPVMVEEPVVEEEPVVAAEPVAPPRGGLWARLRSRFRSWEPAEPAEPWPPRAGPVAEPLPEPPPAEPEPPGGDEPEPPRVEPEPEPLRVESKRPEPEPEPEQPAPDPATVLIGALDSLGQAHHRPFSRG